MKKHFSLDVLSSEYRFTVAMAEIIGTEPKHRPYVKISIADNYLGPIKLSMCIKDKDLERFAISILTALKSKRLNKKNQRWLTTKNGKKIFVSIGKKKK